MNYLGLGYIGIGLGMAGALIGAGLGIGKLASSALDGTARQPEAAGTLQTMMIIPAAIGLALFVGALDLLVALIQAYIFTLLTAVCVGMAVHSH